MGHFSARRQWDSIPMPLGIGRYSGASDDAVTTARGLEGSLHNVPTGMLGACHVSRVQSTVAGC